MAERTRASFDLEARQVDAAARRLWWIFIVTGVLWILFSVIVFRFDYTTVASISILFGIVAIAAGANELLTIVVAAGWWKLLHAVLGALFVVGGVVAFVRPGGTFVALAAVMSFVLVLKGAFDVVASLATRDEIDAWWLGLVVGIAELLLGFWAAGYFGRSAFLLVVWVGALALARGITEIIVAFKLRSADGADSRVQA